MQYYYKDFVGTGIGSLLNLSWKMNILIQIVWTSEAGHHYSIQSSMFILIKHLYLSLMPFYLLQRENHTSIMKYLLKRGADPKHKDTKAQNSVLLASR